jgi:Leucine-rich repeat (LRR) protein
MPELELKGQAPFSAPGAKPRDCSGPLTFDAAALEKAVREAISDSAEGTLAADLSHLAVPSETVELGGIECLSGLTSPKLALTSVSDLRPLEGLRELEELYLTATPVTDL